MRIRRNGCGNTLPRLVFPQLSRSLKLSLLSPATTLWKLQRTPAITRHSVKIPVISKIDFPFRDLICDNCSELHLTERNSIDSVMKRSKNRTLLFEILLLFYPTPSTKNTYHLSHLISRGSLKLTN